MSEPDRPALTGEQQRWALAAGLLFMLALGFLIIALSTRLMVVFALGWVCLQIFGYLGALRLAKGDFAHPLFKAQVMLHVTALALLAAVIIRAFK